MTILDDIAVYKRREIAEAKALKPLVLIEEMANKASPVRGFRAQLDERRRLGGFGLIAEIKKASPSKGLIRAEFAPAAIAQAYAEGGAACLSVLTDKPSFQGAPEYLIQARNACDLPVLRKDFMFEPYQVVEARAWSADCILIIMASVTDDEARSLLGTTLLWGMDAIVEVHNADELNRALRLRPDMIGINNRDLRTFVTDLDVTLRLLPLIPADILVIAESGLSSHGDLQRMAQHGVTNFLIGESLMRQKDIAKATRDLLDV